MPIEQAPIRTTEELKKILFEPQTSTIDYIPKKITINKSGKQIENISEDNDIGALDIKDLLNKNKPTQTQTQTQTLTPAPKEKDKEVNMITSITDTITPVVNKVVDTVISPIAPIVPIVREIINQDSSTFRLTKLPKHDKDFATDWFYSAQKEVVADDIVIEYNAYIQAFEELEKGKIPLPEGFDGSIIADDIRTYVLQDFRKYDVKLNTKDNLIHRAYYCHCMKRAIDSLRQGEYTGPDGYTKKKPEIADALENRINKIIFGKMMGEEGV